MHLDGPGVAASSQVPAAHTHSLPQQPSQPAPKAPARLILSPKLFQGILGIFIARMRKLRIAISNYKSPISNRQMVTWICDPREMMEGPLVPKAHTLLCGLQKSFPVGNQKIPARPKDVEARPDLGLEGWLPAGASSLGPSQWSRSHPKNHP